MTDKYHLEGLNKNKKILKERRKPLPLQMMINNNNLEWQEEKYKYLDKLNEHK